MQITQHFSLDELIRSDKAREKGIDNTPSQQIVANLTRTAQGLEQVRALLGAPIHITSGYRSQALNDLIQGAKSSAHLDGFAADFVCPKFGCPKQVAKAIAASDIQFDKCIQEGSWVHISFAPALRRILLTAHFGHGGTYYTAGL